MVGGVLIHAAELRSTVAQLEKFETAANTFRSKFGYLPGDIPNPDATSFGFLTRGASRGQGDGNGSIEANGGAICGQTGEASMFWVDLYTAGLIDEPLSFATPTGFVGYSGGGVTQDPYINYILPQARIGPTRSTFFYVYSTLATSANAPANMAGGNWFGLSAVGVLQSNTMYPGARLSPANANAIDAKIDDGFPQSGHVLAMYPNNIITNHITWAGSSTGLASEGASTYWSTFLPTTAAQAGSSATCYDNDGVGGTRMHYSLTQSSGQNLTCALSMKMQ